MGSNQHIFPVTTLTGDLDAFRKKLKDVPTQIIDRTVLKALTRGTEAGRDQAQVEVWRRYNLNAGLIKKDIKMKRPTKSRPYSRIYVRTSRAYHITEYSVRQVKTGVLAVIRKGRPEIIKHAFINAAANSGKPIVMQRTTPERYPVKALYTVTGYEMLNNEETLGRIKNRIDSTVTADLRRELPRLLERQTKKSAAAAKRAVRA